MPANVVRTEGLRELSRSFKYMEKETKTVFRKTLKEIGDPFAQEATSQEQSTFEGPLSGFVAKLGRGMTVEIRRRSSTRTRGDFGSLLMRRLLLPLRAEREEETVRAVGEAFDHLADRAGF